MSASAAIGWSATVRMAVTVGFLGGFTTYSSFNQETMMLWERGATSAAMLNLAVTLVGGLAAGWLGMVVGRGLRHSETGSFTVQRPRFRVAAGAGVRAAVDSSVSSDPDRPDPGVRTEWITTEGLESAETSGHR